MQTNNADSTPLSGDYAAAAASPSQEVISRLRIGWGGDLAGTYSAVDAEGIRVSRTLVGDLPDTVQTVEGTASAALDARIAPPNGDNARSAAWWYSRFNLNSPLYDLEALGAPVTLDTGLRTDSGLEYVRKFTGTLRSIKTRSTAATATVAALDYREKLRGEIDLPMIVAADIGNTLQPNLSPNWIISEALGSSGVHVIPPPRDGCVLAISLLGSAWPTVGGITAANWGTATVPILFDVEGPWGPANNSIGGEAHLTYTLDDTAGSIGPQPGQGVYLGGWVRAGFTSTALLMEMDNDTDSTFVQLVILSGSVRLATQRSDGGGSYSLTGPSLIGAEEWHYLAVHVAYSSGDVVATFDLDGSISADNVIHSSAQTWGADWTRAAIADSASADLLPMSAWQISAEASVPTEWEHDFTPTALVERSANELDAILPGDPRDAWGLISDIASAEFATFFFDEHGVFHYWPLTHWETADTEPPVRTLTTTESLIDLAATDHIDAIRNAVQVAASPVMIGSEQYVWSSTEVYSLEPGETRQIFAMFSDAAWGIDTVWDPVDTDGTRVSGMYSPDGTGIYAVGNYTATITPYATAAQITLTSTDPTDTIYFVSPGPTPGIALWGKTVTQLGSGVTAETRDDYSIDEYGKQILTIGTSRWRQQLSAAQTQADYLQAQLGGPKPVLTDVPIIADARLQLGDRVRIIDPDGMGVDQTWRITGIDDDITPGSYVQHISCRAAPPAAEWDTDMWDESHWGGDT